MDKAIRMCQAIEATAADMQSLGVKTELEEKVAAIDSRNSRKATPNFVTGQSQPKECSARPGKEEPQKEGAQSHGQAGM